MEHHPFVSRSSGSFSRSRCNCPVSPWREIRSRARFRPPGTIVEDRGIVCTVPSKLCPWPRGFCVEWDTAAAWCPARGISPRARRCPGQRPSRMTGTAGSACRSVSRDPAPSPRSRSRTASAAAASAAISLVCSASSSSSVASQPIVRRGFKGHFPSGGPMFAVKKNHMSRNCKIFNSTSSTIYRSGTIGKFKLVKNFIA